jgi:hypothetical protein
MFQDWARETTSLSFAECVVLLCFKPARCAREEDAAREVAAVAGNEMQEQTAQLQPF